ncbi:DnaB Replicative DNA helicase [uncultured Caudovirales phage]|uniref:DnaB Replicative DNA helicase n=1 Tax=uncultured Caudovirales phage TaxID=2100421 RepID=A0A6J5RGD8_9CAUD|nr:DnaB Replicative DNA helicase [uncultured Caudovirales phage]
MANSESLVISSILTTADNSSVTKHGVERGMFTVHPNEWKWLQGRITKTGSVPSVVAFRQQFPSFTVFDVDDTESFVEQLKQDSAQARLTDLIDDCISILEAGKIQTALDYLGTELVSIQATVTETTDHYDMKTGWEETYADVSARIDRVDRLGTAGVPTGFGTFDLESGGLQPGWLVIVGGRLGHGKTWTMVRMACEAAMRGYKVMYWSLEQSRHQIAMRAQSIFAHEAGVSGVRVTDLMRGTGVNLPAYKSFMENEMQTVMRGDLLINDTSRGAVSPMTVAASIEQDRPDVVFIDYLTLLQMKGDGEWASVANLSGDLKRISEQYQIPIVVGSQLNRQAIGQENPDPGQLARSDSVGQDADVVVTVTKDKVTPAVVKLNLAKFRHGADGYSWYCKFQPGHGVYSEITGDEAQRLRDITQDIN